MLAAGYLLTHFIHTRLTIRRQKFTLVLFAVGSLLTLSVLPKPVVIGSDNPVLQLLLSLAISVGPPFLVLAMAGPLVQGWVATHGGRPSAGRDVYSLFAISNGASLLALAGYPFVMEPLWGVLDQGQIWEGLFVVEVCLLIAITLRLQTHDPTEITRKKSGKGKMQPGCDVEWRRTLRWLLWSAAGVMVLTSTSGYIGQEIAAIPMFWVIPLALYLVTWILTFSGAVRLGDVACACLALVALVLIVLVVDFRLAIDCKVKMALALTGMSLACLIVHASLYRQRPEQEQLTHFYAAVATGGAIGGIVAGVVATQIFQDWRDLALAFGLVAILTCGGLIPHLRRPEINYSPRNLSFGLVGLLACGSCYLFLVTGMDRPGLLFKHRDFHGLVRVVEEDAKNPKRHRLVLYHGTTIHGDQLLEPTLRCTPTTYFGCGTGAEIAVHAQRNLVGEKHGLNIGVVGLGVGTMAAYLRGQDTMRFYELSPVVAELAQSSGLQGSSGYNFSYLSDAAGKVDVVVGDARLSLASELANEPTGESYDLLVLDAFAGDAIPLHLLTREAFSLYGKHLSNDGMIAVHVSNNWLDLVPVIYAWADKECWQALTISTRGNKAEASGKHAVWMLLFRNQATLEILAGQCRPLMATGKIMVQNLRNVNYGDLRPWTDNRSDLLTLMRSEIRLRDGVASRIRGNNNDGTRYTIR